MKLLYFIFFMILIISCENNRKVNKTVQPKSKKIAINQSVNSSDYSGKYISERKEKEILTSKITTKYGQQYSFCDCIQKGDSLNNALKNKKLSDKELDRLILRFDEIDKKCQSFRLNDANATPRQRLQYKKKVKECLQ